MKRGSILIIALWSLCLLATFAVYLGYGIRQKIILAGRLSSRDNLHFIAEAGVKRAIIELSKDNTSAVSALKDSWSFNPGAFKEIAVGNGKFSVSYDYFDRSKGVGETVFGLIDEERKLNINTADDEALRRLFIILGMDKMESQNLAASVIDWRDADSQLSLPLGSAEDEYYRSLPEPYEAKDSDFEVLSELLLVKGMTPELFDNLAGFITIYGSGRVNINTAPAEVLSALGIDDEIVSKIAAFRNGKDEIPMTADDGIFTGSSGLVAQLSESYHLSDAQAARLSGLVSRLTVASSIFMINSVASLSNDYGGRQRIRCVAKRTGEILSYAEF